MAVPVNLSAQMCYPCGPTPKQMNHIKQIYKRDMCINIFVFGYSMLYAWVWCLAYFTWPVLLIWKYPFGVQRS